MAWLNWVIVITAIAAMFLVFSIHPKGGRRYTIYGADGSVIYGRRNWSDRLDDGWNTMQIQVENWTDRNGVSHSMDFRRMKLQRHWIIMIEEEEETKRA